MQVARLLIASALPLWLGSAFLLYRAQISERAIVIERDAGQLVRTLAVAVDRDLASAQAAALVLASSPSLLTGDLAAFYQQASVVLRANLGSNIVLSDASGQQLVNTLRPFGEPLPRHGNPELLRKVFEAGKPIMSDIYIGGVMRSPVASFDVPVFRDGAVIYDLSVGIMPERVGAILRQGQLPADWIAGVFDSTGTIVARTHAADQFVGQKGSSDLVASLTQAREGLMTEVSA